MKNFIHYVSHSVAAMIGISIYILADTYFIASYAGTDGLAVLNLVLPLYGLMNALGSMLGIGSATRYSIRKARGKDVNSFFFAVPFLECRFQSPLYALRTFLPRDAFTTSWRRPHTARIGNPLCSNHSALCLLLYVKLHNNCLCSKRQSSLYCHDGFRFCQFL